MAVTIGNDIERAADLLRAGQLVAIPTETVYGLAANALDEVAITEIFRQAEWPRFHPLVVHVASPAHIGDWVKDLPAQAEQLAQAFLPGPLTLLLPKESEISDLVTAGAEQVAMRVPSHPMARDLLSRLNFPLAAPSANPFGYVSPTIAKHVAEQLGDRIPYILDGGPCQIGLESTIVDCSGERPALIRQGAISVEALEEIVGPIDIKTSDPQQLREAGWPHSQYAPKVPLRVGRIKDMLQEVDPQRVGILSYDTAFAEINKQRQILLSKNHDLFEAGRRFFAALRYLDSLDIDFILAEYLPEEGLGKAVNDRLRRAGEG